MRFAVPQFIDTEDKIVGPFTLKQFLWLGAGIGIIAIIYFSGIFVFWAFLTVSIPIAGFFIVMAFVKVNGKPAVNFIFSVVLYWIKPRLFIWKRKDKE